MLDTHTDLHTYHGFTFKELHERFPERAADLVALLQARRDLGQCDLCGAPLSDAPEAPPVVAAHIVGISCCAVCCTRSQAQA